MGRIVERRPKNKTKHNIKTIHHENVSNNKPEATNFFFLQSGHVISHSFRFCLHVCDDDLFNGILGANF